MLGANAGPNARLNIIIIPTAVIMSYTVVRRYFVYNILNQTPDGRRRKFLRATRSKRFHLPYTHCICTVAGDTIPWYGIIILGAKRENLVVPAAKGHAATRLTRSIRLNNDVPSGRRIICVGGCSGDYALSRPQNPRICPGGLWIWSTICHGRILYKNIQWYR